MEGNERLGFKPEQRDYACRGAGPARNPVTSQRSETSLDILSEVYSGEPEWFRRYEFYRPQSTDVVNKVVWRVFSAVKRARSPFGLPGRQCAIHPNSGLAGY